MQNSDKDINDFNPDGVGVVGTLFGLPFTPETAQLVIIPVPWEVTVSYSPGTAEGPEAVLYASPQLDFHVKDIPDAWKLGISMLPVSEDWKEESFKLREVAEEYIMWLEEGQQESENTEELKWVPETVNKKSEQLNEWVQQQASSLLEEGKMVAVLGGDHSTPLGFINALSEKYEDFGILQIDAHADLRVAYEGFEYSHASIMYNALKNENISKLVQVGIRDYSESEAVIVKASKGRIISHYDEDIKGKLFEGATWRSICEEVIKDLPQNVYISFDIDGLDPKLCPHTGTPVAGGLEFEEAMYLVKHLVKSGRKIIGFDLCEVAPGEDEWDGNVGARVLYRLCNYMAVSQGKLKMP